MTEINLLLLFMIIAALIAVRLKDMLSSVVAIGAVGIGLSIAFLVLKAPDLAMLQLVVEILSLIILVRATIRKDIPFSTSGWWLFNTMSTLTFAAIFLAIAYLALKDMPLFGHPIMRTSANYLEEGFAVTGSKNIVAAVTLNYRALDTLGEATVIFAAVIGVKAIARRISHNKEA